MSHISSAVFAITIFAAPVVALGVVVARTGGAPHRVVARTASLAATVVSVLVALTLLIDLPSNANVTSLATIVALSLVPATPWVLLRDDEPRESFVVGSMLVSGALMVVVTLLGLVTTFGATIAESINIGSGPASLFVLLPAASYVALEFKVYRAARRMVVDRESTRAARAAVLRARQPIVASPKDALLQVRFEECGEIVAGSPYQSCKLRLDGQWTPSLPADGWIRVSAFSPDRRFTGLAHWETRNNSTGFRVFTIDAAERSYEISDRFDGYCQSLAWSDDKFVPLVWHGQR